MNKVLLAVMLTAALYANIKAQDSEGVFSKMEVSTYTDTILFTFINDKGETAVHLINGADSLKTRISGDYIYNKYVLKNENGIKKLNIYLRPKWNYNNIKGIGFGKASIMKRRVQQQRQCL